jgi:membrane protein
MKDIEMAPYSVVETQNRSSVHSLYVLKGMLAFIVVNCHAPLGLPWLSIPGLGVELFFAITGYFLFCSDWQDSVKRVKSSITKVIPIILILQVFYLLITRAPLGNPLTSYWTWFRLIFMGFPSFDSGHLWYLSALFYGLLFFWGYLRLFKGKYMLPLFTLVIGAALLGPYRQLIFGQPESVFVFNFLTRAVPFLALGYYVKSREEYLLSFNWLNLYILALILQAIEYGITSILMGGGPGVSLLGMFFTPAAVFLLFLSYKDLGKGSWLAHVGAKYSGNIYYFHMAIILGWKALNRISSVSVMIYQYSGAFVVFFLSLLVAIGVVQVQKKLGVNILR